jgi:hypothetical protein
VCIVSLFRAHGIYIFADRCEVVVGGSEYFYLFIFIIMYMFLRSHNRI